MNNYFSSQYAKVNKISLTDNKSIQNWYTENLGSYEYELSQLKIDLKDKKILDVGCGIGGLLNLFKKNGDNKFWGIDSDEEQIAICKKYVTENVEVREAYDFLTSTAEKFDIAFLFDFIEHIKKENIIKTLRAVNKVLNEDGIIVIRTPNMASLTAAYSRYIDFTHEVGFTTESLSYVIQEANFNSINFYNTAIGRKRVFLINLLNTFIFNLFRLNIPQVCTANILMTAKK